MRGFTGGASGGIPVPVSILLTSARVLGLPLPSRCSLHAESQGTTMDACMTLSRDSVRQTCTAVYPASSMSSRPVASRLTLHGGCYEASIGPRTETELVAHRATEIGELMAASASGLRRS